MQIDLEEKEKKYLKAYKENQDLHANLIEERASAGTNKGHRGSILMNASDAQNFTGINSKLNEDSTSKKKTNGTVNVESVLNLKVNQLENQIKYIEEEKK